MPISLNSWTNTDQTFTVISKFMALIQCFIIFQDYTTGLPWPCQDHQRTVIFHLKKNIFASKDIHRELIPISLYLYKIRGKIIQSVSYNNLRLTEKKKNICLMFRYHIPVLGNISHLIYCG